MNELLIDDSLPAPSDALPYFLPYQGRWRRDRSPLRICVKSRQIGVTHVDCYDSVMLAGLRGGQDVFVMSRDELQAKLYVELCARWARVIGMAAREFGERLLLMGGKRSVRVRVLRLASGAAIYALSSNPDAIAGKSGHVKLDEFALHRDQRTLYAVAKPVTQWGGTLSIISTHRGVNTVFNQILVDVRERGNSMGWSLHNVPIQRAVEEGLVEKINAVTNRKESRPDWLARQRAECIDEEQWLQEYCCVPADESSAFLSFEMLNACEDPALQLMDLKAVEAACQKAQEKHRGLTFYLGVDVARKKDLCVLDLGERVGDVVWDRLRIELQGRPFSEIEEQLYRLCSLRQVKRVAIDATGLGTQLAERARARFGWKIEPLTFTPAIKEELAFGLRSDFEDRKLRICSDAKLRGDLRAMKKEVTSSGNIRFAGDSEDSHCDRFWAKALRQHASRYRVAVAAAVG
jgi:phage FluMu gp28-like protein